MSTTGGVLYWGRTSVLRVLSCWTLEHASPWRGVRAWLQELVPMVEGRGESISMITYASLYAVDHIDR